MKILREYLGGSEEIDLDTEEGWAEWVDMVVQDEEVAEYLRDRIRDEPSVLVNEDDPIFIERYTKIGD